MRRSWLAVAALALATPLACAASVKEITVQHIDADVRLMVEKFNRQERDGRVNFRQVSFQSILESLPVQLASGRGPDVSMVADWGGLARYYLDLRPYVDAAYFEREFAPILEPMRGTAPSGRAINGMSGVMTLNGAYVNLTLFKQARVAAAEGGRHVGRVGRGGARRREGDAHRDADGDGPLRAPLREPRHQLRGAPRRRRGPAGGRRGPEDGDAQVRRVASRRHHADGPVGARSAAPRTATISPTS
jgi:hypothetical protein